MIKKYVDFLFKMRWFIIIGVPLLVGILSYNLKHAEIDGSYRIWFEEDSKILKDYDNFTDQFSNDDAIIVLFKDPKGIFNYKALHSIRRISESFSDLPYVDKVSTLINYQYVHVEISAPDDILVDDFINVDNLTDVYLVNRKKIALKDKSILNAYISKDATTTMIVARLEVNDEKDISAEIMKDVRSFIDKETQTTGYKYWLHGGPVMVQAFIKTAERDSATFTPLVFLLSVILLLLLFRRVSGAILPMFVVLLTSLSVLSIQVLLGYKLNSFTINIPVFIVAIGIADAIHIYSIWLMRKREGYDNRTAILYSLEKNFLPILFTSVTTAVGFFSLSLSNIVPISTLGIATASGAILAFFISITWLPAVLFTLKEKIKPLKTSVRINNTKINWDYGGFIVDNNKKIIIISLMFISILSVGLFHLTIDTNMIKYFDKNTEVRKSSEFIMNNITGPTSFEIIVDSGRIDGIKEPAFLYTVEDFYKEYQEKFPEDIRYMTSIKDIIKKYNLIVDGKDTLPQERNLIAQYLLLYEMSVSTGHEITDQIDFNQQKLRITTIVNIVSTNQNLKMIEFAKEWWSNTPYKVLITGKNAMNAFLQKDVTDTIVSSLSLTLLLVTLMMFLLFKQLNILLILMLPNLLPVILVLGVMGWLGINIDMGVAITGAIIISVAVDDSIHFLFKYFDAKRRGLSEKDVFNDVLKYAGKAITFTTLVLSLSFSMLIFSDFVPNRNFGIITATALVLAMVLDLFLLPALLSVFDKNVKEFKKDQNF